MKIACTILAFLLAADLLAQLEPIARTEAEPRVGKDILLLQKAFEGPRKMRASERFSLSRENPNELQMVFSGLFLFYKSFLSSQDNQRCGFHPSCSEYGLEAVKKLGVIRGILCTCDRLSRCNGLSPEQYEIDIERRALKDPVGW
ncbi:MAG: membrane protein insertion efficiency factor YidD [Saprospiraceae bacterium]|nr:membrane protein insertion efficiency factor YidD [Saprospiraceae bacterium]